MTRPAFAAGETSTGSPALEHSDPDSWLNMFRENLPAARNGKPEAEQALLEAGRRLAEQGRPDALAVAQYYLDLPIAERRRGLRAEEKFLRIRGRLQSASQLNPGRWPIERERIRGELLALIQETGAPADCTPAARAHALLARLDVARLDRDGTLIGPRKRDVQTRGLHHTGEALRLFGHAKQRTPQLEPLWLQAELMRLTGEPQDSAAAYREVRELALLTQQTQYTERALQGLVQLARESGDPGRVQALLSEWANLQSPTESWPLARETAAHLLSQDNAHSALQTLWNCKPEESDELLTWEVLAASALRRRGHLPAARRSLEKIASAYPEEVELLALTEAQQWLAEGEHEQALEGLDSQFPFDHWSAQGRVQGLTLTGECLLLDGDADAALEALQVALDDAQSWESRRIGAGSIGGEWLGMHTVVLAAQAAAELGDWVQAVAILESNQGRNWKRDALETLGPVGLTDSIRAVAEEGAGMLAFGFGPDFGIAIYAGDQGAGGFVRIEEGRPRWTRASRRLQQAIQFGQTDRARGLAREISRKLFPDELRELLFARAGQPLCLLAHGPLESLPLSLLEWDAAPLVDRFLVRLQPGIDGKPRPAPAPGWGALPWRFIGAPSGQVHAPLPGALRELETLAASRTNAVLATGGAFHTDAVLSACQSNDALHIATHLVPENACATAGFAGHGILVSEDRVVCADSVANCESENPLVYLGTCSSATGRILDGEGTLGIGRAFLASGTHNLVLTLWPVRDEAAARFASRMHAALSAGWPPSRAVALAQNDLMREGFPPSDWAAFQHMGWH